MSKMLLYITYRNFLHNLKHTFIAFSWRFAKWMRGSRDLSQ